MAGCFLFFKQVDFKNCYEWSLEQRHHKHSQHGEANTRNGGSSSKTAALSHSLSFREFNKAEGGDVWFGVHFVLNDHQEYILVRNGYG